MGGAGEELDLAPHSARRPQHQPFFVLVFTLAPSGFCGWCSALHLTLLGRLQEEAEALASSTLFFSPCRHCQEVLGPHREKGQEKDAVGWERQGSHPPLCSELLVGLHGVTLPGLPKLLVVLPFEILSFPPPKRQKHLCLSTVSTG